MLRGLQEKRPGDRVSVALNPRCLKVERSRNLAEWFFINPQIPKGDLMQDIAPSLRNPL